MSLDALSDEIANLRATIAQTQATNIATEARISNLQRNHTTGEVVQDNIPDTPVYNTENSISLEPIRSLPEFNGNRSEYRGWKTLVKDQMKTLEPFKGTNTYYVALSLLRHKIKGPALNILITYNTIINLDSILNRLDYAYADQRPKYILMDGMRKAVQGRHTLYEHYDNVNKLLNLILNQLETCGQEAIIATEMAAEEAVRAFTTGIKNKYDILQEQY